MSNKASPFRQGAFDALIFFPILAPFSMLFGVFASDLDLSFLQTLGYTFGVFAGASQIASLSLVADGAPIVIAVIAGCVLNMRFLLYSATLTPHFQQLPWKRRLLMATLLIDQSFVLSENKLTEEPNWNQWQRSQYYLGITMVITLPWYAFTILGFFIGNLIPPSLNIAFALPISFIALIMPALKTRAHWVAAIVSVTLTLLLHNLPYNLGLLIAGLVAIIAAGQFEARFGDKQS